MTFVTIVLINKLWCQFVFLIFAAHSCVNLEKDGEISLHTLKLTWHLQIGHPKRKVVFQPSIFRCYVSFWEGNIFQFGWGGLTCA